MTLPRFEFFYEFIEKNNYAVYALVCKEWKNHMNKMNYEKITRLDIAILKWAINSWEKMPPDAPKLAALNGDLESLIKLHKKYGISHVRDLCYYAAKSNDIACFSYVHSIGNFVYPICTTYAVFNGNIILLEYLRSTGTIHWSDGTESLVTIHPEVYLWAFEKGLSRFPDFIDSRKHEISSRKLQILIDSGYQITKNQEKYLKKMKYLDIKNEFCHATD